MERVQSHSKAKAMKKAVLIIITLVILFIGAPIIRHLVYNEHPCLNSRLKYFRSLVFALKQAEHDRNSADGMKKPSNFADILEAYVGVDENSFKRDVYGMNPVPEKIPNIIYLPGEKLFEDSDYPVREGVMDKLEIQIIEGRYFVLKWVGTGKVLYDDRITEEQTRQ